MASPVSVDFPDVRAGIVALLKTIPEIKRVLAYNPGRVEGAGNMPFAEATGYGLGKAGWVTATLTKGLD